MAVFHRRLADALAEMDGNPDLSLLVKDSTGLPWYFSRHLRTSTADELVEQARGIGCHVEGGFWVEEAP